MSLITNLYIQVSDEHAAAGKLLDLVSAKLDGNDRTSFDQLVYALVQTEQLESARLLDEDLTRQFLLVKGPTKHGQPDFNSVYFSTFASLVG